MSNQNKIKGLKVRKPERAQVQFVSTSLDDLIDESHLARKIWHFVESLNTTVLFSGLKTQEGKAGQRAIDRQVLLALWLYALISGITSGREIARRIESDNPFKWIAGGLHINYHTIDDFRSTNKDSFGDLMVQMIASMISADVISGETIAVDGMKISAKAKGSRFHRKKTIEEYLAQAEAYLKQLEESSMEELNRKKKAAKERATKERVTKCKKALATFEELKDKSGKARVSITESEARVMKGSNGAGHKPSYNVQVSTDVDSFIITGIEVTQDYNDSHGIEKVLPEIEKNLGKPPKSMITDAGYPTFNNMALLDEKGIEYYSQVDKKKRGRKDSPVTFFRENSKFDKHTGILVCPANQEFKLKPYKAPDGFIDYKFYRNKKTCEHCNLLNQCLGKQGQSKQGMFQTVSFKVKSDEYDILFEKLKINNETDKGQELLKKRFSMELPHAVIKQLFKYRQACVQTMDRVKSEILLVVMAHNFLRWQSLQET